MWSEAVVLTINLPECCGKPYHHKPRMRRYLPTTSRLLGVQPDDRRPSQQSRGVIAPLMRVLQARTPRKPPPIFE